MSAQFCFYLNGEKHEVRDVPLHTTLLDYVRGKGLTGSKQGCAEGDCGACTVLVAERNYVGATVWRAHNSCLVLLPMLADRQVLTIEGATDYPEFDAVQKAMISHGGSQCGYCTPGFVMSMCEATCRKLCHPTEIAEQLGGNLCRCTGYRSIRDAISSVPSVAQVPTPKEFTLKAVDYSPEGSRFFRPVSLKELLFLRREHPDAVLVAGATELAVEMNKKERRIHKLIGLDAIDELRAINEDSDSWSVGGGASLTDLLDTVGRSIPALAKILRAFASRQIRSRATVGGNLVTASPIADLPPIFLALGVDVELRSHREARRIAIDDFFVGYRKTALRNDELLTRVFIPKPNPTSHLESYKVSKRMELDISAVAAGFYVLCGPDQKIIEARLGYGGVAERPKRARKTETQITGQHFSEELIESVRETLADEFAPISDHRATAEFRRALVVELFYKFLRGDKSEAQDLQPHFVSRTTEKTAVLSKGLAHESAVGHATGAVHYVDDEAQQRPMLELWPVLSSVANARVRQIDIDEAKKVAGIEKILLATDIPGTNDIGAIRHDEPLLAQDYVHYCGHPIAFVVGTSLEACKSAASHVNIRYEELPAVLGIEQARRQNSFHSDLRRIRRGDAMRALQDAPCRLSGTFAMGGQEHFYLETQAAYAVAEDDGIKIVSSTQHPSEIQGVVGHILNISRNRITVESPRMGGGFGGKETQGNAWAAAVALASWHTKKPVRVQLDRDIDMTVTGKRHPFLADFRVGFDNEGYVLALEVQLFSDGGWALDLSESIMDRALFHIDNAYYVPNLDVCGRVCKTNTASNTAFRGFGGPQGMLVIEEVLDRVARYLNLPPELVRERNLYRGQGETNRTHYGQDIGDNRLALIWDSLTTSSALVERRQQINDFNRNSPMIKRGIAITPVKFGISFTASFLNQAGSLVQIYRDGTVQVNHGGTEMGQGLHTKILGIAARELGIEPHRIRIMKTRTDKVPNTSPTAASSGADLNGAAVQAACASLRGRLEEVANDCFGIRSESGNLDFRDGFVQSKSNEEKRLPWHELIELAYLKQVSLSATGFYCTPDLHYDKKAGRGKPFHYFACGAAVAEVEIDGYCGMKKIRRVDILHDVGDSLNPGIDRGQIEGGFVQGAGWLTSEELVWSKSGALLTHSASTYQIPAFSDAPADFRVDLLPRAEQSGTIHGSKAVGEPPLMLAFSVREALKDAIAAFGKPGGFVHLASPATPEAIYRAICERRGVRL